jgi:hypothetical protein
MMPSISASLKKLRIIWKAHAGIQPFTSTGTSDAAGLSPGLAPEFRLAADNRCVLLNLIC